MLKVLLKYFLINVVLLVFHYVLTVLGAMAFGGPSDSVPTFTLVRTFVIFILVAIAPNMLVFLFSVIRKKRIKENALWAFVFVSVTIVVYIFNFKFIFE